jgi:serine/threonine protein kinase
MDSIPKKLGPYEILREIGRGGMGIVYLAREEGADRLVALKVLPTAWTNDPVRLKRFQREAECVKKVRHANIVPIYDVGSDCGMRYIAMKYVEGTSLDMLIREQSGAGLVPEEDTVLVRRRAQAQEAEEPKDGSGDLPDPADATPVIKPLSEPQWIYRAVRIVEKIARALAHLHEHGIVHRDVKPGNILMDQFGGAWLADFGLVRDADASSMSHMDGILGTVQYIAPEQIEGDRTRTDHRSDLYSLGVTLYELVTLRRPFDGRDPTSTLYAVAREAPEPPRKVNPKVPEDLERVILKAMAKDPDARYQTGSAFADDLRRVRTFEPVRAARPPAFRGFRRLCARNPVLTAAAAALIVCFLALLQYCVYSEIRDRGRLVDCRAEGDAAFDASRFEEAADNYRLYLKLGGDDAGVVERLRMCQEAAERIGQEPGESR